VRRTRGTLSEYRRFQRRRSHFFAVSISNQTVPPDRPESFGAGVKAVEKKMKMMCSPLGVDELACSAAVAVAEAEAEAGMEAKACLLHAQAWRRQAAEPAEVIVVAIEALAEPWRVKIMSVDYGADVGAVVGLARPHVTAPHSPWLTKVPAQPFWAGPLAAAVAGHALPEYTLLHPDPWAKALLKKQLLA